MAILNGAFTLDLASLGIICGVLVIVDVVMAFAVRGLFRREEILTRWA
jgi:hypothetical protein